MQRFPVKEHVFDETNIKLIKQIHTFVSGRNFVVVPTPVN